MYFRNNCRHSFPDSRYPLSFVILRSSASDSKPFTVFSVLNFSPMQWISTFHDVSSRSLMIRFCSLQISVTWVISSLISIQKFPITTIEDISLDRYFSSPFSYQKPPTLNSGDAMAVTTFFSIHFEPMSSILLFTLLNRWLFSFEGFVFSICSDSSCPIPADSKSASWGVPCMWTKSFSFHLMPPPCLLSSLTRSVPLWRFLASSAPAPRCRTVPGLPPLWPRYVPSLFPALPSAFP